MDRFQELLWDLGELVKLPLHIDKHHACTLLLDETLRVQLQMDRRGEHLILWAYLPEIPPGRFRENVLRAALNVNSLYHPWGSLAYYDRKSQLILQQFLPAGRLTAQVLLAKLEEFIEEAAAWHTAIKQGESSPSKYRGASPLPSPFFIPR